MPEVAPLIWQPTRPSTLAIIRRVVARDPLVNWTVVLMGSAACIAAALL